MDSLPHGEMLSAEKFSALDYINATFVSTASLTAGLEDFSSQIAANISELDVSISNAIQSQSSSNSAATNDVKQAEEAIVSLKSKIEDIASKADRSEKVRLLFIATPL